MKKFYVHVLLMCFAYGATAQTERGTWLVGGSFNINTTDNATINFNPTVGYFIINNLSLGGVVLLEYDKLGENSTTTFGAGPLVRYYFPGKTVKPFLNGELSFVSQKLKVPSTTNTENGMNYFLGFGLAAFLHEEVALETIAGYTHTKLNDQDADGGFAMRVGFQVYLHPRKALNQ